MSVRVAGHTLQREGAAYGYASRTGLPVLVQPSAWFTTAGEGRGLCSCGALSRVLPSAAQRKAWHREHKAQVISGEWTARVRGEQR